MQHSPVLIIKSTLSELLDLKNNSYIKIASFGVHNRLLSPPEMTAVAQNVHSSQWNQGRR